MWKAIKTILISCLLLLVGNLFAGIFVAAYYLVVHGAEGLEKVPMRYAIVQANRYMVQHSDYLIAYPGMGNSRKIVEYAQGREKKGLIKVTLIPHNA